MPVERKCENCGKKFFTSPSRVNVGKGKYCSKKCAFAAHAGKPRCYRRKRVELICEMCGSKFIVPKVREKSAKFCSKACFNKWKKGKTPPMKGRKHTAESKAKMSKSIREGFQKGRTVNMKGGRHKPESIRKMREALKGRIPWNKGTKGVMVPWNKGKTMEDERVRDNIEKRNKTMNERYPEGYPPELRKKMSEIKRKLFYENPDYANKFMKQGLKVIKPSLPTKFGWVVRSKGEQKIANWFFDNNIKVIYEKQFNYDVEGRKGRMFPDFYLSEYDLYVEFFGGYRRRKDNKKREYDEFKKRVYNSKNLALLALYPKDLDKLDKIIPKKITGTQ